MNIMPELAALSGTSLMLMSYVYKEDTSTDKVGLLQVVWALIIVAITIITDAISIKQQLTRAVTDSHVESIHTSETSLHNSTIRSLSSTPKFSAKRLVCFVRMSIVRAVTSKPSTNKSHITHTQLLNKYNGYNTSFTRRLC